MSFYDKKTTVCFFERKDLIMKFKLLSILFLAIMISACSSTGFDISKYTTVDANATTKAKLKACLISEANTKFQNGTLFSASISATAEELTDTCIKKLALESAGISTEAQSTASTIIQNLKNLGSVE